MNDFTIHDLERIMRTCAGAPDSIDLDLDTGNRSFDELGFDSLAVMEIHSRIQQELGVAVPDDAASQMTSPNDTVRYVRNARMAVQEGSRPS